MNDRESELTDELLRAQHQLAEVYRKSFDLEAQHQALLHRLNVLTNGQDFSIDGTSTMVKDHGIDLHIQETLRLRKTGLWRVIKSLFLALKIRRLHLFDFQWYLERYPDLKQAHVRPFKHFLMHGIFEGRDPSPHFNTRIYLAECRHMLNPGEPAFIHYLTRGRAAGIPASTSAFYPGTRLIAVKLSAIEERMATIQDQLIEHTEFLKENEETLRGLQTLIASKGKSIKKLAVLVASSVASIKETSANNTEQLGKLIGLQNYLIHGEHPLAFRGRQISPDLGLFLIELLSKNRYDLIIEFGSGTSTVLMARIVASLNHRGTAVSERVSPQIIAFEHLPNYHEKSVLLLEQQGLLHIAQVHLAPLEVYGEADGTAISYYDCQKILSEVSTKSGLGENSRILVLVDGPPEGTNLMARFPALDVLKAHFPLASIELILDGYRRPNELAIVETWARECARAGIPFSLDEVQTEKGCAIFRYRG